MTWPRNAVVSFAEVERFAAREIAFRPLAEISGIQVADEVFRTHTASNNMGFRQRWIVYRLPFRTVGLAGRFRVVAAGTPEVRTADDGRRGECARHGRAQ